VFDDAALQTRRAHRGGASPGNRPRTFTAKTRSQSRADAIQVLTFHSAVVPRCLDQHVEAAEWVPDVFSIARTAGLVGDVARAKDRAAPRCVRFARDALAFFRSCCITADVVAGACEGEKPQRRPMPSALRNSAPRFVESVGNMFGSYQSRTRSAFAWKIFPSRRPAVAELVPFLRMRA